MALLGNFLGSLLLAWLWGPGLGVPLAPADRAPAVGEWTDHLCTGPRRGSAKSRRCVGGWAQDTATLVTVAKGQTTRSLGLSHGGGAPWTPVSSRLLGVCLHPESGMFRSQGREVKLLFGGKCSSELAVGTP